jgi:hypothetical protein
MAGLHLPDSYTWDHRAALLVGRNINLTDVIYSTSRLTEHIVKKLLTEP